MDFRPVLNSKKITLGILLSVFSLFVTVKVQAVQEKNTTEAAAESGGESRRRQPLRRVATLGGRSLRQHRTGQGAARRGRRRKNDDLTRWRNGVDDCGTFRKPGHRASAPRSRR